ncbi:hypothetical protein ACFRFJ_42210 [Streptomyces hydrogenans]|uniref:hypothetical protein n=1 Tax=Streptomyces hydrogenans TaxID=1873719 RepID=UPI0036A4715F
MATPAAPEGQRADDHAGPRAEDGRGGLRATLGGLTTRGRSFLAAGAAAAVCAYVLGQADLLRVGMLFELLTMMCAVVVL